MANVIREGAQSDADRWQRNFQSFARLFQGRDDVIAERIDGEYVPREGSGMTLERFKEHVTMARTYAIYNKDDTGGVRFGLFDLDILPRNQGWDKLLLAMDEKKQETKRVMQTLMDMGLERKNLLVEFPTVGFHLFVFFDAPVQARLAKSFMRHVLTRSGLDKVPFYPMKVGEDAPWGDKVQLPLRTNLNTNHRSNFIRNLDSFDPLNYSTEPDFGALDGVVPVRAGWVAEMAAKFHFA